MAVRTVEKRVYRNGVIQVPPLGTGRGGYCRDAGARRLNQGGERRLDRARRQQSARGLLADRREREFTAKGLDEPFPGINARTLNVIEHKRRQ